MPHLKIMFLFRHREEEQKKFKRKNVDRAIHRCGYTSVDIQIDSQQSDQFSFLIRETTPCNFDPSKPVLTYSKKQVCWGILQGTLLCITKDSSGYKS